MLPHRFPFLLIDKVIELNENSVVGIKNVTMNEGFFVGHFPDEPVMPGVLQIEAMAQTGGIFTLSKTSSPVREARNDHLLWVSGVEKPSIPRSTSKP